MIEGQNNGDSAQTLTVDSAAPLLDRMFSGETEEEHPETQTDETPEAPSSEGEEPEDQSNPDEEEVEPSEDDDAAEPDEDEDEQPQRFRVKANGSEEEVTLDELLKGYSREKDYTQKSQKLAEERRRHETEVAPERDAVRAERQRVASQLTELETALKSLVQEPDWDKLRVEHPDLFADTWAAWSDHKKRIDAISSEREAAQAQVRKDFEAAERNRFASEAQKLLEAIPAWGDTAVREKEATDILAYGKKLGFDENEIRGVSDHRALVTLRKAMLFDRAQETANKAKQTAQAKIEKVKAAAPGAKSSSKKAVSDVTRLKQRHAKVGTAESAAEVFSLMFDN